MSAANPHHRYDPLRNPLMRRVSPYLAAFIAVLVLLGIRAGVDAMLGYAAPMLILTIATVIAGWLGGFWPALFATGLSLAAGWFLLVPVRASFLLEPATEGYRLALFGAVGLAMSILSGRMHRSMADSRRAEDLFRRVLLEAPIPMMLHREDGTVLELSHAWTRYSGYTVNDIPTIDAWTSRAYGDRQTEVRNLIKRLYATEKGTQGGEQLIRTASGDTRTWVFRATPMGCDENGLRLILSVAEDVTDRKMAEQERAKAYVKLQATIDSITDGLLVLDHQWNCTYISETGARMLGKRSEDVLGHHLWKLFPDAEQRRFYGEYHESVTTSQPRHFEEYYPEPLGLWLECHCYPSSEGLSVYFRDITERKNVQEALARRTAELDSLFANAPIGFAFLDREHRYIRVNDRLAEMNGAPVAAHAGRTVREMLPLAADLVEPVIDQVFATSQPVQIERPAGGRYWLAGFYPLFGEHTNSIGVGCFVVDTTEQRAAERAVRESTEHLQLALDSARMGTFDLDVVANRVVWDERSRELYGIRGTGDIEVDAALMQIHEDDRERIRRAIAAAYDRESGGAYHAEYRTVDGGQVRWIISTGRVYFEGEGEQKHAVRFIGLNIDVTESKQTEMALSESEERFRIAAAAAQLGLFEWDPLAGEAVWNGNPFPIASIHPDDQEAFARALEESVGGERFRITVRILREQREDCWLKFEGAVHRTAAGSPRLLAITQDISASRRLEDNLRRNEAYLTAIFQGLPVGVGTTNAHGQTTFMNAVGLRLHGFASLEEMYTRLERYQEEFELLYPDGRIMAREEWPIARVVRGEYVSDYEVVLRRSSTGEAHTVSYTAVPVLGVDEETNVFVMQDVTERRRAEERMRASEAQYRTLFESIDEGFCVLEMQFDDQRRPVDYRFLEANPAFKRHTGLVNAVGRTVRELVPGLDESWFQIYGSVALTGKAVRFENEAPAMGRVFDVYAFRAGAPELRRVALLFNDITKRKKNEREAETSRREAEAQRRLLDAVLDSLPVGVIIVDEGGRLIRSNRANEQLWGIQALTESQEQVVLRALFENDRPGGLIGIERFDGGGRRFVMTLAAPVRDEAGKVIATVVAQTDVTDRVNMERALRESEDKFRTISDNIPQLAWMADQRGRNLWYNRRWFEYTGMSAEQVLQSSPDNLDPRHSATVHPEDRSKVGERWQHSLSTGEPYEIEFRFRRQDGTYRWFLGRALPIREGGRIVRWFGSDTDIHEQKNTEGALRRSNEDLQQFAYVASHDLQEPLRTVVTFSQLLARRYQKVLDDDAQQYLAFLTEAALRMSDLVRDLLVYSRATQDGDRLLERVELAAVLRDVLVNLRTPIEEARAEITHDPLPVVTGDQLQLGQVFQNLISNALKYRRVGVTPQVHIGARRGESEWVLSVADNGQGFSQEYQDRIFGIFKRLHGRDVPGTGIGLAICRTVVERHGGRIWAESEKGVGSTFYFSLPDG
jgi:PAS domain S-box-containing protein